MMLNINDCSPFPFMCQTTKGFHDKGEGDMLIKLWRVGDCYGIKVGKTLFNVYIDSYLMYSIQHLIFDSLDLDLDLVFIYHRLNIVYRI